jgi:hypothetical protein
MEKGFYGVLTPSRYDGIIRNQIRESGMTIQLIRKPPVDKKFDSLRVVLEGNHTLKQKIAMMLEAKFMLEHDQNIHFAGNVNLYINLVDQWGHPLTHFPNGDKISDYILEIKSPYHCAADHYERRMTLPLSKS